MGLAFRRTNGYGEDMTNEDLRIVQAVLRESARLSNGDADALTREITRRCEDARKPQPVCQVEHPHWGRSMICGNPLLCVKHGGR